MNQPPPLPLTGRDPTSFGRFTVEGRLGSGGMGIVYRARDPVIGRAVAIKTLHLDPDLEPEARETLQGRFEREFRSAGSLTHPNIVTVYDVGHQDDLAYIAMELVEGKSLEELLGSSQQPTDEHAASILRELGDALDYAHRQGVVHRDVKPANILFSAQGRPKIADFGVAKARSTTLTTTGTLVGTPGFIAPEHILGGELTGAADQFSLAVVAYRLLGGISPFEGEDSASTLYKIAREDPPPLSRFRPDLPPAVEQTLNRAMAKEPVRRFPSCAAFARELSSALGISSAESLLAATRPSMAFSQSPVPPTVAVTSAWRQAAPADAILDRPIQPRHVIADHAVLGRRDGSISGTYGDATQGWRRRNGRNLVMAAAALVIAGTAYTYWSWQRPAEDAPAEGTSSTGTSVDVGSPASEGPADAGSPVATAPATSLPAAPSASPEIADAGGERPVGDADATPAPLPIPTVAFTVTSTPPGATVLVDGAAATGTTPLTVELLTDMEQSIEVRLADHHPQSRTITPETGTAGALAFNLEPVIPPGHIAVRSDYALRATISGRPLTSDTELAPGRYEVRLAAPQLYFDEVRTVVVEPGSTTSIRLPPAVTVRVAAVPSNAVLIVDGKTEAPLEPPLDLEVVSGSRHLLRFSWPDQGQQREKEITFDESVRQVIGSPEAIAERGS